MKKETKYWFKNKLYGWGWYPATKEGWAVLLVYIALIFVLIAFFTPRQSIYAVQFFATIAILTLALIIICWKTGEKPEWRWNGKPLFEKKKN